MKFNVDKCKVMHFGHSNPENSYKMNGTELQVVKEEKDCRVMIADNLKPSVHCTQQYGKTNRMLGLLKRTVVSRNPASLLKMYKTIVRPHVEYCVSIWSPSYKKDKETIERVQHRFTRLFKELRGLYNDRLSELGLWSLEERHNRADLVEVFKIITGQSSVPASTFFDFNSDTRMRGHSLKLLKHHSVENIRSHFFSERVINRWNRLPSDVVTVKSINSFKAGLQRVRDTQIDFFMDK